MPFVQLDDQIAQHPKVLRAGAEAAWLWACAIAYSNRQLTDGYVPTEALATMGTFRTPVGKLAATLVAVRLFEPATDGYQVHDYLQHNPDRSTVLQRRAQAAERKARQRDKTTKGRASHADVPTSVTRVSHRDIAVTDSASRARVPTPTPTPTDDDTAQARAVDPSSSSRLAPVDLHGWRMAAMELLHLWRSEGPTGAMVAFETLTPDSRKRLREALAGRSLDQWAETFRRVSRSDYLAGRGDLPAIALWRALEMADRIDAGEFDNRAKPAAPEAQAPMRPQDVVMTAAELAEIREGQRRTAEAEAARIARGEPSVFEKLRALGQATRLPSHTTTLKPATTGATPTGQPS